MKKKEAFVLAALASVTACAGQNAESQPAQSEQACDVSDPKNREILSQESEKTVYRVCDDIFVSQNIRTSATTVLRSTEESIDASVGAAQSVLEAVGVEDPEAEVQGFTAGRPHVEPPDITGFRTLRPRPKLLHPHMQKVDGGAED